TALAEIREPALAIARQLARRKACVRLLRIVGLVLDAGEVAKRGLVDRVATPILAARSVARSDGDDHARLLACADDHVLRLRRAMDEIPCLQAPQNPKQRISDNADRPPPRPWVG